MPGVPAVLPVPAGGVAPLAPPVLGLLDPVLPLLLALLLELLLELLLALLLELLLELLLLELEGEDGGVGIDGVVGVVGVLAEGHPINTNMTPTSADAMVRRNARVTVVMPVGERLFIVVAILLRPHWGALRSKDHTSISVSTGTPASY